MGPYQNRTSSIRGGHIGRIRFILERSFKAVSLRALTFTIILIAVGLTTDLGQGVTVGIALSCSFLVFFLSLNEIRRALALAYGSVWFADAAA